MAALCVHCERGRPCRLGQPFIPPRHQRGDDRIQVAALFGEHILVARRSALILTPFYDAMSLQIVEAHGQDVGRNAQVAADVFESRHPSEQVTQDQRRPSLAHHIDGTRDRAGDGRERLLRHVLEGSPLLFEMVVC